MRAVMFASHDNLQLQTVLHILKLRGIEYKVYGKQGEWRGFGEKLRAAHQAAKELRDEHILFLDAYDTVVLGSENEILAQFEKLEHPWVCNAEPNIWPPGSFEPEDYPQVDTPWKYLNSGAYLAERTYLLEQFDRWVGTGRIPFNVDDQRWLAGYYLSEPGVIKLDTDCELFQCLIGGWWAFETEPGVLYNTHTCTHPLILHHNGGADLQEQRMRDIWAEA